MFANRKSDSENLWETEATKKTLVPQLPQIAVVVGSIVVSGAAALGAAWLSGKIHTNTFN